MQIKLQASTKPDYHITKEELNLFAGRSAGVCYMKDNLETLHAESKEKTLRRANMTKANGHHSVFEHTMLTFELENIPKLFAMLLNNEKVYTASEKSARYTNMQLTEMEQGIYKKWLNTLTYMITNKYSHLPYFTETRINKIAMENARYFTSVMTPTTMIYTVSYRQLNYMCGWMKDFDKKENQIYKMLKPAADEFLEKMESLGFLDEDLMNEGKEREFSLIRKRARQEQFGETYTINYCGSLAMLGQAQRHRTLSYEMELTENSGVFVPKLLEADRDLYAEWIADMCYIKDLYIPQGKIVEITERGNYENLILKAKERLCTAAQYEIMAITNKNIQRYIANTDNDYVKNDLEKIVDKARCASGYKCTTPCSFKEGIDLTRDI